MCEVRASFASFTVFGEGVLLVSQLLSQLEAVFIGLGELSSEV